MGLADDAVVGSHRGRKMKVVRSLDSGGPVCYRSGMMRFLLTSLAVLALATPAAASEITMKDGSDPAPYVALFAHARYMPTPPSLTVQPDLGGCPFGAAPRPAACAESTGTIYMRPDLGFVALVHEAGHEVDFALGSPAIPGYNREQVADTWAACALWGPNTADAEVVTPDYAFHLTPDEYRADCDLLAAKSEQAGFEPRVAEPPASWRRQAVVGLCATDDGFYADCPRPVQHRKARWPRWLGRWHWGRR